MYEISCTILFILPPFLLALQSYCDKFGADLLRIDSVQEAANVKRMIQGHPGKN